MCVYIDTEYWPEHFFKEKSRLRKERNRLLIKGTFLIQLKKKANKEKK